MKVRIITEREFADSELSHWIRKLVSIGVPIQESELRQKGFVEFDCDNGYTKAHTRYEIVPALDGTSLCVTCSRLMANGGHCQPNTNSFVTTCGGYSRRSA
jgi:hypothetical protein